MATVLLRVRVKPNARASSLHQAPDGTWQAQLKSPPVEGKANEELISLVADHFRCRKADVVQFTVVGSQSPTRIQIHTGVSAPNGCAIALDCALDNRCPLSPKRPLKCYGPITSAFYCCWKDPW